MDLQKPQPVVTNYTGYPIPWMCWKKHDFYGSKECLYRLSSWPLREAWEKPENVKRSFSYEFLRLSFSQAMRTKPYNSWNWMTIQVFGMHALLMMWVIWWDWSTVNIGFWNHPPSEGSRLLKPARPLKQGSGYSNQVVTGVKVAIYVLTGVRQGGCGC